MKKFKKSIKEFAILMSMSILFASCYNEQSDNPSNSVTQNIKKRALNLSGEEIFKSIIFADGKLVEELPSLKEISMMRSLSVDELNNYRDLENQAIGFLNRINTSYFEILKRQMTSGDPEIISLTIRQTVNDLAPFVNSKLALQGLSIDKLAQAVQRDNDGKIDMIKTENEMRQMCCVFVLGPVLVVAAVALLWIVAVSTVIVVGDNIAGPSGSLTLESISIQIAERVK
jgi:SdpC family antimicrobial peptide